MVKLFHSVAHSTAFHHFITGVILFAGVLVGLERSPTLVQRHAGLLHLLDAVVPSRRRCP